MPVNSTGQGNSPNTPVKQQALRYFMHVHTGVVRGVMRHGPDWVDQRYVYIDTNAGTGRNNDGTPGSVLIAAETLAKMGLLPWAYAIENNPEALPLLRGALQRYPHFQVLAEDNATALDPGLLAGMPGSKYGVVYCDPNGVTDLPFAALMAFFQAPVRLTQRIDLLISLSATFLKRCRLAGHGHYTLPDILTQVNKRCWYIRKGYTRDQWTFLFGTNWDKWPTLELKVDDPSPRSLRSLGLYRISSPQGQSLLEELSWTQKELEKKSQPPLLTVPTESISPTRAFRRLGGRS